MLSIIGLEQRLKELKQEFNFGKIAELLTYSLKANYSDINRQVFGYIPELFREIEISKHPEDISERDLVLGEPVVYKIYFPSGHTFIEIPFFYLFCYLKENSR